MKRKRLNNMPKIMMISPKDNNFYNFRRELIFKMRELGYEVYLVCPYGKKMDVFIKADCNFIDLKIDRRGTNPLKDFQQILFYKKILKEVKPDVVLTYTAKCSIYGGIACGKKYSYIANNAGLMDTCTYPFWLDLVLNVLYKIGFKNASCMMYQNKQERDYLNKILKNKVKYIDIPGSGVNLGEFSFQPYPKNDNKIVFNFVGRIVEIKGIVEFIECAKRIHRDYPNTKFVIYGDYDDDSYKKQIQEGLEKGYLQYGGVLLDMKPAIMAAHAVIHPSYYEGMTNVVLEHSAMGRVCIGSDIPGVADGIEDGVTGYVFECKNIDSLVQRVRMFIELPHEKKAEMGLAARKKMEREFNREIVTNIYLDEISAILRGKKS